MNEIYGNKWEIFISAVAGVHLQMQSQLLSGSYLHVFIEQNHHSEAEEGTSGYHANQNWCEEFMWDNSLWDTNDMDRVSV